MERDHFPETPIRSYRDLRVWQAGMDLVVDCYKFTGPFPKDERFGLTQQMRRAAVSIPSNIAEGYGRVHLGEYIHHLSIANGSLKELETQILIANRLSFLTRERCHRLISQTSQLGRMLSGLTKKLTKLDPRRNPKTRHLSGNR